MCINSTDTNICYHAIGCGLHYTGTPHPHSHTQIFDLPDITFSAEPPFVLTLAYAAEFVVCVVECSCRVECFFLLLKSRHNGKADALLRLRGHTRSYHSVGVCKIFAVCVHHGDNQEHVLPDITVKLTAFCTRAGTLELTITPCFCSCV